MKKQLLNLMILFISVIGYSQTFIHNNITYSITSTTNNTVTVIDYNITAGTDVVIPETVTPNDSGRSSSNENTSEMMVTYSVTGIGYQAFISKGVTSVIIPDSVTSIGTEAFYDNALTSVILPSGLVTIKQSCFVNNQLTNVTIPDSVVDIETQAFSNNSLNTVVFGSGLITIGFNAFYNNNLTTIALPNGVTTIEARAFDNNQLSSVTIPGNVTTIGFAAFRDNLITCIISEATTPPTIVTESNTNDTFAGDRSNIDLTIPSSTASDYMSATWTGFNSVTESDFSSVFTVDFLTYQISASGNNEVIITDYDTTGGSVLNIPATVVHACETYNVTEIGYLAFNSSGLTDVSVSDSVVTIGDSAFSNNSLTNITIPNSVTTIETDAFNNNQLAVVTLSDNLIYIGESSFAFNDLTSLTIPNSVITIDDGAFAQSNNLTSLSLGDNVSVIGDFAFRFTGLTNITLPASVTDIGVNTFGGLSIITDVYCEGLVPPTISTNSAPNSDTFNDFRGNIHLHIPVGTMGTYVTDPGALWTGFNPVTEDATLSTPDFELTNDIKVIATVDGIAVISPDNFTLENYTIYSVSGAKVVSGTEPQIDTNSFSKGIYILKLDFDKGTTTKKVVIN